MTKTTKMIKDKSVLHIRIDSPPGYKSDAIAAAFVELGFEYFGVDWHRLNYQFGKDIMRKMIREKVDEVKPDLVFAHIQNPEALDEETWDYLVRNSFVIHYTFDVRQSEEMQWMYDLASKVNYTFFASMEDVSRCKVRGIENVGHSHSSCDMNQYKPLGKNIYAFDVVFVGNKYDSSNLKFPLAAQRQEMISVIDEKYNNRSMIYGLGQRGGMIQPDVEANIYNFSRISLSQNNFNLTNYTSDRLWRIMASGSFCLTAYFPGIERIFEKEIHLDWFNDFDEMVRLIDFYLSDDKERKSIAECGMNFVRENHTWRHRIEDMLNTCKF